MKKILLSCIMVLSIFALTGCFEKKGTATCTKDAIVSPDDSVSEIPKQEIIINYKGNNVTKATVNYIYSDSKAAKEQYDALVVSSKDNNFDVTFKLDGNKIKNVSSTQDVLNLATVDGKIKQKNVVLDGLRKIGYICN